MRRKGPKMSDASTQESPLQRKLAEVFRVPSAAAAMQVACAALLRESGIVSAPVPLKPLWQRLGMQRVSKNVGGEGTLRLHGNTLEIWVDPDLAHWRRARFTVAHEISHGILLRALGSAALPRDDASNQILENLCNLGAAELLMPSWLVRRSILDKGLTSAALRSMYDLFLVSYTALLRRISDVLPSSAVYFWKVFRRTEQEETALRIVSSSVRYGAPLWLPRGCTVRHTSPDIVSAVVTDHRFAFAERLSISRGSASQTCLAIAGQPMLIPIVHGVQLPLFAGRRIPDETKAPFDAFLLVSLRDLAVGSRIWLRLEESIRAEACQAYYREAARDEDICGR